MLEPGHQLGRYRVETQLGAGGMGEVYRAWDSTLQRWVALKVVAQNDGTQRAERLLGEARAAAALHHPNIVSVFDVGEEGGYAFVSMDLVEGRPLRDYIGDASVPQDKQLAWLLEIASALRAAHKAGLVHRDIKPDNVMITTDGEVRVLDFGLAKTFAVDVDAPTAHEDASGPQPFLTGQGRIVGTPAYMAPEQLAGGPASPSWDQYAWGVLACELLTGKHPRIAGLVSVSGWIKPESLAHVPEALSQAVARAMAPTPDQRFPSMDAIVAALGGPVSGSVAPFANAASNPPPKSATVPSASMNVQIGDTLPVPVHPNAPVQRRRPRLGWVVAGSSVLLLAGASTVWWREHPRSPPAPAITATNSAASPPASAPSPPATAPSADRIPSTVASASAAPRPSTTTPPPPVKKLSVELRASGSLQYDTETVARFVNPMKPLVQSCFEQHRPRSLPVTMTVDLELWNVGSEIGKVRDARLNEPSALGKCLRDVFLPLQLGPPKSSDFPPGAVFVTIHVVES